jgi:hypothetical protein
MKDLIKVIFIFLFVSSCTTVPNENITVHVTILNKVDFLKLETDTFDLRQYLKHGRFNSVKIDLLNNSDSALYYWTNSCSWQSNWILDNKSLTWYVMCPKNVPVLVELPPHYTKSYFGLIEFTDSTIIYRKRFKIGFVLVRKSEVRKDYDYNPILYEKIRKKKDIFWSNSLKPRIKKLSITRSV